MMGNNKQTVVPANGTPGEFVLPGSAGAADPEAPMLWGWKNVRWGFVLKSQLWASALLTIGPLIGLILCHYSFTPTLRPYFVYDATISYALKKDTIPSWVSVVIPLILLIISLLVGEFLLFKPMHRDITNAVSTSVHFFLDAVLALIVTLFMTELSKLVVGRLRPDFIERCQPATLNGPIVLNPGHLNPNLPPCTAGLSQLNDGHKSFPSGHASSSAVLGVYNAGYFLWAIYFRHRTSVFTRVSKNTGFIGVLIKDLGQAFALYWCLFQICLSWGIGMTRYMDNKHNISDVIGGWLLGALIAIIFVLRAIPTHKYVINKGPAYYLQHTIAEADPDELPGHHQGLRTGQRDIEMA